MAGQTAPEPPPRSYVPPPNAKLEVRHFEAIEAEYLKLQDTYERFDDRALTIKAWGVTLYTAAFGAAYVEAQPALLLLSSLAALMFWMIEAYWKANQQAFGQRMWEIENTQPLNLKPFQTATTWWDQRTKARNQRSPWRRTKREYAKPDEEQWRAPIMRWPEVYLPHAVVLIAGAVLFVVHWRWWELT